MHCSKEWFISKIDVIQHKEKKTVIHFINGIEKNRKIRFEPK